MSSFAERYQDLIASGDEAKIKCVLGAGLAGGVTAGVGAAAVAPVPAIVGISAVIGVLIGLNAGLKVCGAGTEGHLEKVLSGQLTSVEIEEWTKSLVDRGLKPKQAHALVSASIIELRHNGTKQVDRHAPFALHKLQMLGDQLAGVTSSSA